MLLIGNGRVCTRDECAPWLEDGGVLTDGEVIREVGPLAELRSRYPQAQFIDAKGGIIMPGLINAPNRPCGRHVQRVRQLRGVLSLRQRPLPG